MLGKAGHSKQSTAEEESGKDPPWQIRHSASRRGRSDLARHSSVVCDVLRKFRNWEAHRYATSGASGASQFLSVVNIAAAPLASSHADFTGFSAHLKRKRGNSRDETWSRNSTAQRWNSFLPALRWDVHSPRDVVHAIVPRGSSFAIKGRCNN